MLSIVMHVSFDPMQAKTDEKEFKSATAKAKILIPDYVRLSHLFAMHVCRSKAFSVISADPSPIVSAS
jgi:hypothetical protein